MLNDKIKLKFIEEPYPIWVIDDIFNEETINTIKEEWLNDDSPKWNTTRSMIGEKKNILENKMLNISDVNEMPDFISSVCLYLHSEEFTKWVELQTGIDGLVPDETFRWSGMRVMKSGSYQMIHSDAREHPENGLRKELTCLLYFNDEYDKDRDEGCLEIWNDDMTERTHELEPINNRLVIFLNSNTSYHGVPSVKKDRKAITFSILKNEESSGRQFAKFVCRPSDPNEVDELGAMRANG